MGAIDITVPSVAAPVDTPTGFVVTPGAADLDHGSEKPDRSVFGAAFRQDNSIGSFLSNEVNDSRFVPVDPNFRPWDQIKGTKYEGRWKSFVDVSNETGLEQVKRQLDKEEEDRKTLAASPWYQSLPAQVIAGGLDWPTLLPTGSLVRGATGVYSGVRSALNVAGSAALGTTIQERALHSTQETRALTESLANVGASAALGFVLGSAGAGLLNKAEWDTAVKGLDENIARLNARPPMTPGSVGAAAVEPLNIEGNAIAGKAAGAVAAATARLNPALRILQSPSPATREVGTQLFESSVYLRKHLEGVADAPAVETLMKEYNAGLARAIATTDNLFSDYRKGGGSLSRPQFHDAIGSAMRNADEADDPFVARAAKEWRSSVFDPLKNAAIDAKLLPEDVSVDTAASYFTRMWNRNRLIAEEPRFKGIVEDWLSKEAPKWAEAFDKETIARGAALEGEKRTEYEVMRRVEREARFGDLRSTLREIADEVFNKLTGKTTEAARPEFITVKARGPLKERTFNIPDKLVEDFLESDVDIVGRRYSRIMGADVELARKFGSPDMTDQIQKIREDYKRLREGATSEAERNKLSDAETADVRDIEALRDLLRGTRLESPIERNYGRLMRMANMVNYIRSMGEVVLASITDAVRPAMVHGLGQFMETVPQLLSNLKAVKLSVDEARLAGNVVETVLKHRLATISEIVDPYASRGPVEAFLENATNVASKWNGIRIWTDMMKSVASVMTQNRILSNIEQWHGGGPKAIAFHGSPNAAKIKTPRPSDGGELGAGFYFARDEKMARGYTVKADAEGDLKSSRDAGVLRIDMDRAKIKEIDREEFLAERSKLYADEQARNGGEWSRDVASRAEKRLIEKYQNEGFDGLFDTKWKQGVIFPDRLDKIAIDSGGPAKLGTIPSKERKYLAFLGIDESMAERIAAQFKAHGENIDGVRVANTESWTDPVAVRTYRAAMNKDVDSIIVQKGVADVPLFASTPTGRMLLQFKSFALASHQRILLRGLQEDQTRFVGGMVAMTAMGMLITYLKAVSGNRTEKQSSFFDNPGWWIGEGLDRSGVLSVPMELANTFERATGVNPIKSPMKAFDEGNALSQKNQNRNEIGALLGPTAGLAQDVMVAGAIPKRMYEGEEVTQAQKNSLERLAPFSSFPGFRQMLRYLVNTPD